jgi:hypothetical protein
MVGGMDEHETDLIVMNDNRGRRRVRPAALAGVAFVAVAAGTGAGYAASHRSPAASPARTAALAAGIVASPSPSPSTPAEEPGKHGRFGRGDFIFGLGFGPGAVLHGQVVVPKSGGGYQTLDVQRGTVTAVSSNSITVKSTDGYTATYAVTSSTIVDAQSSGIGSVKTGDTVFVTATVRGSTATAASVADVSAIKAGRADFGFPGAKAPSS